MADIFNGGTVKLFYNLDTANQNVISSGNIEIENVASFPTFSISDSANKIETYDSEYTRTVVGDKAIGDLEIVVNYRPDSETHQFLDSAYDNKTEFQLIVNYIEDQDAGKVEAVIVSGNINSRMISGDKDDVVRMTYTYSPRTIISMGTRLIPPVLRRGDYGVGSDGTPDYPQYSPQEAEGNAFVMIPAADTDNPAGTDLYGIELVSQPTGQSNTNLMMTNSGDLRIYARNNTTPWSRVYTSGESDTLYLSKANNLSDLDSVITARSNLGILSTTENDARYMIGSRNLSELTDVVAARTKLGIISTLQSDAKYLQAVNNLSELTDVVAARTNLGMSSFHNNNFDAYVRNPTNYNQFFYVNNTGRWGAYDAETLQDIPLGVQQGGTGSSTPAGARTNLQVERLYQDITQTTIASADGRSLLVMPNNSADWGAIYWNGSSYEVVPLSISRGGTGSTTVQEAKINLQIERLQQQDNGTFLRGNGTSNVGLFVMDGTWGAMNLSSGGRIALPINNGGTGALTVDGARNNLNLGAGQSVDFSGVNANQWSDAAQYNGGVLTSRLMNTSNGTRSWSRFYSEIQADGIPKTTIHSGDGATRNAYMQFTCTGLLSGIDTLSVNTKIRTPTIAVTDRMSVGTPGDAQALGARSIAIGDSDTGFAQRSDGILDVYTNAVNRTTFSTEGVITSVVTGNGGGYGPVIRKLQAQQADTTSYYNQLSYLENSKMNVTNYIVHDAGNNSDQNVFQIVTLTTPTLWFSMRADSGFYTPEGRVAIQGSDIRIKRDFKPVKAGAWDRISAIKISEFKYKNNDIQQRGYLAQDMRFIDPDYVFEGGTSTDENGNTFEILNVNDKAVNADVITVVQELQSKVESNEETIAVLSAKVDTQQQQIDELKALVQSLITK
ncbi:TPA: tail fiber domain-containing protein [Salmonella enterica subsp. enterica serovar Agona]|nr:tail fiber domain-containing protein [Salmonella enterica subsp. enterica serovar Agona]HCL1475331.1 tail fiber domain-containing protein [Salmonella enterica subsp. enterica serovar Agona]HCL1499252.1 tail fiber domain-containing protein [Salmonella enterica subsp. enterica serovar Derby]HCL1583112.1 tail fiber domain-containing protein [Salmonella enterica subsp. enterica serovar Agona]HCL1612311.1 tail fiber domain-containing protein [Salmonella enterica subsp. enterica serovar Agona]